MIGRGPGRYPHSACSACSASIHAFGVADGKWFINHVWVLAYQSSTALGCASLCAAECQSADRSAMLCLQAGTIRYPGCEDSPEEAAAALEDAAAIEASPWLRRTSVYSQGLLRVTGTSGPLSATFAPSEGFVT